MLVTLIRDFLSDHFISSMWSKMWNIKSRMKPIKERGKKSNTKKRNMFQFSASTVWHWPAPSPIHSDIVSSTAQELPLYQPIEMRPNSNVLKMAIGGWKCVWKKGGWGRGNLKKRLLGCQFAQPVKPTPESEPMLNCYALACVSSLYCCSIVFVRINRLACIFTQLWCTCLMKEHEPLLSLHSFSR